MKNSEKLTSAKRVSKRRSKPARVESPPQAESPPPHQETIQLMGFVNWTDPMRKPELFVLEAPYNPETESACLHLDIKLRSVASIEVRPARRPLKDTAGVVADALRLANTPG